jgi:hypothetical protein
MASFEEVWKSASKNPPCWQIYVKFIEYDLLYTNSWHKIPNRHALIEWFSKKFSSAPELCIISSDLITYILFVSIFKFNSRSSYQSAGDVRN